MAALGEWLTRWLGGWPGFVLAALFIYFSGLPGMEIIACFVILISLSGRHRLLAFGLSNLAIILFFDISFWKQWSAQPLLQDIAHSASGGEMIAVKGLALLLLFGIFWALSLLHRRIHFRYTFTLNFAVFLALVGAFQYFPPSNVFFYLVTKALAIFYSRFFWVLTFTHLTLPATTTLPITEWLASLPFWTAFSTWHIGAIPRGVGELRNCICTSRDELRRARVSGLKMLATSYIFLLLLNLLGYVVTNIVIPHGEYSPGIQAFIQHHFPVYIEWALILTRGISFVFYNVQRLTLLVGVARFCGFQLPPSIFDLFRSRSFGDFIRHFYYYYSETICYFFMPTAWRLVGRLPLSRRAQNGLTSFFMLFSGGVLVHLIEEAQYGLVPSLTFWYQVLKFTPYLFLLALFVGISAFFQKPSPRGELRIGAGLLYFMLYFIARIPLLWFIEGQIQVETPSTARDLLQYVAALFGF